MIPAYAKINLCLDVLGKEENGFHRIDTVMARVDLADEIKIEKRDSGIELKIDCPKLPVSPDNLAWRAADLFFEETGIAGGASIFLQKRIPICAGLGDGSADGAAVLDGLNQMYQSPLSGAELVVLAAKLGSDVPYCLMRKPARGEGLGTKLTPIRTDFRFPVVIVKPTAGVSTKEAYEKLDRMEILSHPDVLAVIQAYEQGNMSALTRNMGNVLELSCGLAAVGRIKQKLREFGARGVLMSGSGSAVFGIFTDYSRAVRVSGEFSRNGYHSFAAMTL